MRGFWMIVWAAAALIGAAQAHAAGELDCRSSGFRYQYCSADTGNSVQLIQQSSKAPCMQGRTWGYDARGIWVDNGCAATFRYGRDHGSSDSRDAAAAVAGALIIAAIANSQSRHHSGGYDSGNYNPGNYNPGNYDSNVPGWAVGRFAGEDFETGIPIELAIDRNGQINGIQGSREFYGQVRGNEAWIGNRGYGLVQTRNGIQLLGEGRSGFTLRRN
ncbi:MAG TPA: DUF3011 domain-containing protein [Casimicrobiaceae bacterium]|nr:DUF3011 domain-containing protein [Casimicrobiaceae bacterium]